MPGQNKKVSVKQTGIAASVSASVSASAKSICMTVKGRQQTLEEQHRFKAATDALLSELVRQQETQRG